MLNTFLLNTTASNNLPASFPSAETQDSIVFNGYGLQNESVISQILRNNSLPQRDLETAMKPRAHGEFLNGDFWRRKLITISGIIKKATKELFEAELDKFKQALSEAEAELDLVINGEIRRYKATLNNPSQVFEERQGYHVTFTPFSLQFLVLDPFGKSVDYDSVTYSDLTNLNFTEQVWNSGTVKALPQIILNFTNASDVTGVVFKNNTTGEEIEVTQSISAGDYLKIDAENCEVLLNGSVVDYEGFFPSFEVGANSLTVEVGGVSATYTLTYKYKKSFL